MLRTSLIRKVVIDKTTLLLHFNLTFSKKIVKYYYPFQADLFHATNYTYLNLWIDVDNILTILLGTCRDQQLFKASSSLWYIPVWFVEYLRSSITKSFAGQTQNTAPKKVAAYKLRSLKLDYTNTFVCVYGDLNEIIIYQSSCLYLAK